MKQHTPGPWTVVEDGKIACYVDGPGEANGEEPVAVMRGPDKAANVHLVAAAPDLLAALHHCLAYMRSVPKVPGSIFDVPGICDAASAAIAKAEGSGS